MSLSKSKRVNIDEPQWDQSTYMGRARHFFVVTNPLNLFCSRAELDTAKEVVTKYRWVSKNIDKNVKLIQFLTKFQFQSRWTFDRPLSRFVVASQTNLRLGTSSGNGWTSIDHRPNVGSSSNEHADHRLYANLLQVWWTIMDQKYWFPCTKQLQ